MPSSEIRSRASSRRTASGSAPTTVRRSPVREWISGHARSSTCRPLRGSCLPAKTTRCSRPPAGAAGGVRTPFGMTSYSPGSQRFWDSFARSETAIRWSILSMRKPHSGTPPLIHPRSPDAWNVATRGQRARMRAVRQIVGVIGSCRWTTSKRSRSSARTVRKYERGERTMFGSEPFAGTITERPTGMTLSGGSPWRPTRGCRTRVNWPGGSLPITRRTSWPSSSSAVACSSACSTTAPQNDHENGTTIPIFTRGA